MTIPSDRTERQAFLTLAICVLLCAVATGAVAQSEFVRKGNYALAGSLGVFSMRDADEMVVVSSFGVSFAGALDLGLSFAKNNQTKTATSAIYAAVHDNSRNRRRSSLGAALFVSIEAIDGNWALGIRAYKKRTSNRHFVILPAVDLGYARVSKSRFSRLTTTEPFVQLSFSFVMGQTGATSVIITPSIVIVTESGVLAGISIGALLPFGTDR